MIEIDNCVTELYQSAAHTTRMLRNLEQVSAIWNIVVQALDEIETTLNESDDISSDCHARLNEVRQKAQRLAAMHR